MYLVSLLNFTWGGVSVYEEKIKRCGCAAKIYIFFLIDIGFVLLASQYTLRNPHFIV